MTKLNENLEIGNTEYTLKDITNNQGKILWTNPSPTSDFASQTIILSSDDYDMLEIFYHTFNNQVGSSRIFKGKGTRIITSISNGTVYMRIIDYVDDTHFFASNIYGGSNGNLKPLYIIGYKTGLFS
jgi:hypothetical protein